MRSHVIQYSLQYDNVKELVQGSYYTMVVMSDEVFFADEKVVICVKFPELAVDNIEVFVWEKVHNLVDVLFLFQHLYRLFKHKQIQLRIGNTLN